MSLSIKGKVSHSLKKESGTSNNGKNWVKQGFVIDTGDQYNPLVAFTLFGEEKIALLKGLERNMEVEVFFNLNSREWEGRWFHNVEAWKIEKLGDSMKETASESNEEDSLPF